MYSKVFLEENNGFILCRDDLFPKYYGGNKARKLEFIENDIKSLNNNAVVTTGGIQSNHCRVVALMCAKNKWKCSLVLHGDNNDFYRQTGNAAIMRMCGADVQFVAPNKIGQCMSDTMKALKKEGYSPFYLYGGGHNKTGVEAYINAVKEVYKELGKNNKPDHIFLASGTGSTQAGILLGLEEVGWNSTSVHGISIARNKKLGFEKISEAIQFKNQKFDLSKIIIYDDYRFGGYGISNLELKNFTFRIAKEWGIILDTTYTGKAFFGMMDIVKKKKITGNIIFWHTGGLLNLMA